MEDAINSREAWLANIELRYGALVTFTDMGKWFAGTDALENVGTGATEDAAIRDLVRGLDVKSPSA